MLKGLKPDPTMMCNGMLAGLVAITAPCAFVDPLGGGGDRRHRRRAGRRCSVFFWEARGIDDPVGAISVHGVNGLWGVLSVGIFANGKYGAGWNGVVRDEMVQSVRLGRRPRSPLRRLLAVRDAGDRLRRAWPSSASSWPTSGSSSAT